MAVKFDFDYYEKLPSSEAKYQYLSQLGEDELNSIPREYQEVILSDFPSANQAPSQGGKRPSTSDVVLNWIKDKAKDKAIDYGTRKAGDYLSDNGAAVGAGASGIGNAAEAGIASVDLGNGASGVMLADGSIVPGVATDAATGGTVLADGSVVGGNQAAAGINYGGAAIGAAATAYGLYTMGTLYGKNKPGRMAAAGAGTGAAAAATYGAMMGSSVGPVGTLAGAAIGALVGVGLGMAKTGRHVDVKQRSHYKDALVAQGLLARPYSYGGTDAAITQADIGDQDPHGTYVQLADGSWVNINGPEKNSRSYNTDLTDPRTAQIVADTMLIGNAVGGDNYKVRSDFNSMYANAALAKGDPLENVRAFYDKLGIKTREQAEKAIESQIANGIIKPEEKQAYENAMDSVFNDKYALPESKSGGIKLKTGPNGEVVVDDGDGPDSETSAADETQDAGTETPESSTPAVTNDLVLRLPPGHPLSTLSSSGYGTKQSNGKYRLSPGVYSDTPPPPPKIQGYGDVNPSAPSIIAGAHKGPDGKWYDDSNQPINFKSGPLVYGKTSMPESSNRPEDQMTVDHLVDQPDTAVDYLKTLRDGKKITPDEYNAAVYGLGSLNTKKEAQQKMKI